jgi:DNA-binding XRE family transcriptional regulator
MEGKGRMKLKGSEVAEARERLGRLSQDELAELLGTSQSTVSRWESKPDERIDWWFSRKLRGLLRRARKGLPLGPEVGVPAGMIRLQYPDGVEPGPEVWIEDLRRRGRERRKMPAGEAQGSAQPEAGDAGAGGGALEGLSGPARRFVVWVGTVATTAVLASCLVRAQGGAERASGAEARRGAATADLKPPADVKPPEPQNARKPLSTEDLYALRFSPKPNAVAGELGERNKVRFVPREPLPNQAVAPCRGSETSINGSCWIGVLGKTAPCPPDTYQEGNYCYVPVAANPKVPLGELPNPEPR